MSGGIMKNCKQCGSQIVWKQTFIDGSIITTSSDYIPGCEYCHDCMVEHCLQTNCLMCNRSTSKNYKNCDHFCRKCYYMNNKEQ